MTDSPVSSPNSIDQASAVPPGQPCTACNTAYNAGARFCPECGKALQAACESRAAAAGPAQDSPTEEPAGVVDNGNGASSSDERPLLPLVGRSAPTEAPPKACVCGAVPLEDAPYCHKCGQKVGQARWSLIRKGNQAPLSADIGADELTIGSAAEGGVVVSDDEYVSRRHARVTRSDGLLFLEDLGSSNGTFLRVRRPIVLESGDEIVVGASVFHLSQDGR